MNMNETSFGEEEETGILFQDDGISGIDLFSTNESVDGNNTFDTASYPWEEGFLTASRFWVQRVLVPIVVIVGVLGNLVTIYILTRRPMRSSTNVYLCALAVSDMLFLLFTFTMSLDHYPNFEFSWLYWAYRSFGLWLTDAANNFNPTFTAFKPRSLCSTSVWLTVSFTIERYIAVCHPMRGKVLCTEERAIKVAILVYVICFAVTSPTPFEWKLVNLTNDDNATIYMLAGSDFGGDHTYQTIFYWFSSISFVLLPVGILAILNFILIQAVRRSRILRKAMTQNQQSSSVRQMQTMRQENRITIILIAVVILFLICQVPTALVLIYVSIHKDLGKGEAMVLRALGNIFNLLMALNASCNFLLYTALSDKYRKYFCAFFLCWRRKEGRTQGLYEHSNPYELDTMNTTMSLSRATSLRILSSTRNQGGGSVHLAAGGGGFGTSSGGSSSSSMLRRAQTCHATNARSLLGNKGKNSNNSSVNLVKNSAGSMEFGGGSMTSFKKNSILGSFGSKKGPGQSTVTTSSGSAGIHISLNDASIPLIQVDQV